MKYVAVDRTREGYWLDPTAYLAALPSFASKLPLGARAFAEDAGHYNIGHGLRCVKDLWFTSLWISPPSAESASTSSVTIRFEPNVFKHDKGLTLVYFGVTALSVSMETKDDRLRLSVTLDELLPAEHGFTHEIGLIADTSIILAAADLEAFWE